MSKSQKFHLGYMELFVVNLNDGSV